MGRSTLACMATLCAAATANVTASAAAPPPVTTRGFVGGAFVVGRSRRTSTLGQPWTTTDGMARSERWEAAARRRSRPRSSISFSESLTTLFSSSSEDDSGDENTITIALTSEEGGNDALRAAIADHPVVSMMGVKLDLREMPCVVAASATRGEEEGDGDEENDGDGSGAEDTYVVFSDEQKSAIEDVDMACFATASALSAWLVNVDAFKGYENMEDEEKRKLGPEGNGNVVAACADKDLAKTCLETGRWEANNIYYPAKDSESLTWADSAAMAIGDVMERKFWGGGW
uniref:Uncharacterized protein n=1 Tax=Pseudictyota dubia TaxID=2749911 RepID=A0A7R9W318_9STRA